MAGINRFVFGVSCPILIAPHIPIASFDKKHKPGACVGFARRYLEKAELDEEIKAGYLKYIKERKNRLYSTAVQHGELLQVMFTAKMVTRKDIDLLLEECDKQNNTASREAVLEYAGKSLKTVDTLKEFNLGDP